MQFQLDEKQQQRLNQWIEAQDLKAIEQQKEELKTMSKDNVLYENYLISHKTGHPYTGAIAGGLTYSFSPTGLGTVIKVKYALTNEEIDLTNYNEW